MLFPATNAGSLPKPEWLAEPDMLWAPWKSRGAELARAKRDATMLALKLQEDAGLPGKGPLSLKELPDLLHEAFLLRQSTSPLSWLFLPFRRTR